MNAEGTTSDVIIVVGNDEMGKEDFHCQQIQGLSTATTAGAKGWLCMVKSRGGNAKLYKFIYETVVKQFVRDLREDLSVRGITGNEGGLLPAALLLDGEDKQIQVLFQDDIGKQLATEFFLYILKLAASCSPVQQPCDLCKSFMSTRTYSKHLTYSKGFQPLEDALSDFMIKHVESEGGNRKVFREGIVTITSALQCANHRSLYTEGWIDAGLYPIDISKIIRNCDRVITDDEYNVCINNIDAASKEFMEKGELTEEYMDILKIPVEEDKTDKRTTRKNERPIHQRRVTLLTNLRLVDVVVEEIRDKEADKKQKAKDRENKTKLSEALAPQLFDTWYATHVIDGGENKAWQTSTVETIRSVITFMDTSLKAKPTAMKNMKKLELVATLTKYFNDHGNSVRQIRISNP